MSALLLVQILLQVRRYSNLVEVNHVTFSKSGGAGIVASILVEHQNQLGSDARLFSLTSTSLQAQPLQHPVLTLAAVVDRFIVSADSTDTLFSLYRNRLNLLKDLRNLGDKGVVHLHWTSGLITNRTFRSLVSSGRRIVWTLHDMVPFTGGCHHAHDCDEYLRSCEGCPQVRTIFQNQVRSMKIQNTLDGSYSNLSIVTPTKWMERAASSSLAFGDSRIITIPNPISDLFFAPYSKAHSRRRLGIPDEDLVLIVIANNLADPAKGIGRLVQTAKALFETSKSKSFLLLVGSNGNAFHNVSPSIRWLGPLSRSEVPKVAVAADWVLSGSAAESAGMTIAECAALGVPAVALNSGGIQDMIIHGQTGLLCETYGEFEIYLSQVINHEQGASVMGQQARTFATQCFHPDTVAQRYLNLYSELE